jgi:hypothetical protein
MKLIYRRRMQFQEGSSILRTKYLAFRELRMMRFITEMFCVHFHLSFMRVGASRHACRKKPALCDFNCLLAS